MKNSNPEKSTAAAVKGRRGRPSDFGKHDAILREARRLFTRFGLDHTSMDAIADSARVSKATVYQHFGNKQVLFETVLESLFEDLPTPADVISKPHGPLPQRLREIAENASRLAVSPLMRGIGRLLALSTESPSFQGHRFWRSCLEPYQQELAARLQDEAKAGRLCIPDAALASSQFLNLAAGAQLIQMLMGGKIDSREAIAVRVGAAVETFLRAYSATSEFNTKSLKSFGKTHTH